jgi:hypothetical protein
MRPESHKALASSKPQTLLVNTAIMDTESNLTNFPWALRLGLFDARKSGPLKVETGNERRTRSRVLQRNKCWAEFFFLYLNDEAQVQGLKGRLAVPIMAALA